MQLENASAVVLAQLESGAGTERPTTLAGMIEQFGGGKAGKSALARELAAERGVKYESARRNIERYTTTKEGAQHRTPKELQAALDKIAQRQANQQTREASGRGVRMEFSGTVRISNDERPRSFTVTLSGDELAAFLAEAQGHHWKAAADELNYALLDAWDGGRGGIIGHNGVITDVDELSVSYVQ